MFCNKPSLLLLFLCALSISCSKDRDPDPNAIPGNLDFSEYLKFNDVGDAVGIEGQNVADEYKMEEWQPWVYKLFEPMDTAVLSGTAAGNVDFVQFFPSPLSDVQAAVAKTSAATVFKFVIISQSGEIMARHSRRLTANQTVHAQYDWRPFAKGYYRIYYSFSSEGSPHYFRAHADTEKK